MVTIIFQLVEFIFWITHKGCDRLWFIDTILMVVDSLNRLVNVPEPRDSIFASPMTGVFAHEIVRLYNI